MEMIEIDGNQRGKKKRRSFVSYRHGNGNFMRMFKEGGKVWSVGSMKQGCLYLMFEIRGAKRSAWPSNVWDETVCGVCLD